MKTSGQLTITRKGKLMSEKEHFKGTGLCFKCGKRTHWFDGAEWECYPNCKNSENTSPCCKKNSKPEYKGKNLTFYICPCGKKWKP
jgi:hypothetical protein